MKRTRQLSAVHKELLACRRCLAAGHEISPGAVFSGQAQARVMVIGQAPGLTEVTARRPFNAGSGRRLFEWLDAAGWDESDFRDRHYMTSVTKCYPGKTGTGRGDRVPTRAEQALCRPFLDDEIRAVAPRLIIPVGGLAIKLFFPARLRLAEIVGQGAYFPPDSLQAGINFNLAEATLCRSFDPDRPPAGRWVVPLPHPSGASLWPNRPANQALLSGAIQLLRAIRMAWQL